MKRGKAEVIGMTKNDRRPWHISDLAKEIYLVVGEPRHCRGFVAFGLRKYISLYLQSIFKEHCRF